MLESVCLAPIFLSLCLFLFQLCIRGGLEASWWTGENKSCLQNKRSRFWQKCWWRSFQSFNHKASSWRLLLCCLSACGATLAEICIFFLESVPYVYVQRSSDLRSLLNGWRVPELRQCKTAFKAMSVSPVNTNRLVRHLW